MSYYLILSMIGKSSCFLWNMSCCSSFLFRFFCTYKDIVEFSLHSEQEKYLFKFAEPMLSNVGDFYLSKEFKLQNVILLTFQLQLLFICRVYLYLN